MVERIEKKQVASPENTHTHTRNSYHPYVLGRKGRKSLGVIRIDNFGSGNPTEVELKLLRSLFCFVCFVLFFPVAEMTLMIHDDKGLGVLNKIEI